MREIENIYYTNRDLDHWIQASAHGERDALHKLYRAAAPAIYAYALSLLQNPHDAEDVLHDCFLTVQTTTTYRSQRKPMAWLICVTKNLCLKQLHQHTHAALFDTQRQPAAVGANPQDRLLIESCLTQLDELEQQIVILHAVAGFTFLELGQQLHLKTPTVITKYRRAIRKLKRCM